MATPDEIRRYQENIEAEKEAIKICKEKIAQRKLEMKLVTAHFLISEPKALFFFTAEDRVDFRELVKDLVSVFRMRIELRQIGVRDEARVLGGLAVCGRDFCCHSISDKLDPVTIKMAKEQNMSLNSMKISGPCGRLLCCLSYEYDFYVEEKQSYPPEGSKIKIGDELYRVQEVNILSRSMTLSGSEGRTFSVPRSQVRWSERTGHWEVSREFEAEFLG
jgi:cell fate regulator YaaT (PSP1 superfamily)